MKEQFFVTLLLLIILGCGQDYSSILPGQWQAHTVQEDGRTMELDPTQVKFSFDEEGGYTFSGTLNYYEAGSYYLEKDLLFTTDTVNGQSIEKVVRIQSTAPDSLIMTMDGNGKEQIIQLFRNGQ